MGTMLGCRGGGGLGFGVETLHAAGEASSPARIIFRGDDAIQADLPGL